MVRILNQYTRGLGSIPAVGKLMIWFLDGHSPRKVVTHEWHPCRVNMSLLHRPKPALNCRYHTNNCERIYLHAQTHVYAKRYRPILEPMRWNFQLIIVKGTEPATCFGGKNLDFQSFEMITTTQIRLLLLLIWLKIFQ